MFIINIKIFRNIKGKAIQLIFGYPYFKRANWYRRRVRVTANKLVRTYTIVERICAVLKIPPSYVYERDDVMADIILAVYELNQTEKSALLKQLGKK